MELLTLGLLVVLVLAVVALYLKKNTTGNPADTARLEAELAAATSTGTLLREQLQATANRVEQKERERSQFESRLAAQQVELDNERGKATNALADCQKATAEQKQALALANEREVKLAQALLEVQHHEGNCAKLTDTVAGLDQTTNRLRQELAEAVGSAHKAETTCKSLTEKLDTQKQDMVKMGDEIRVQFQNVANDLLKTQSQEFKLSSAQSVEALIKPWADNLVQFKEKINEVYLKENTERQTLKDQLDNIVKLNVNLSEQAQNLTNALRNSKTSGDWGEGILEQILEHSGLQKNVHYRTQVSFKNEETGNQQRPDVIVDLPQSRCVVIDSKVSLMAYEAYSSQQDEILKKQHLAEHVASIKRHILDLGGRDYAAKFENSPEFVLMFVPIEPAYMLAMQADSSLWQFAYEKHVIILSATNLITVIRLISEMWRQQVRTKEVEEIARLGTQIHNKIGSFTESMNKVGNSLESARDHFSTAKSQLYTGNGNLLVTAKKLETLGIKVKKKIDLDGASPSLLEPMVEEEEEAVSE